MNNKVTGIKKTLTVTLMVAVGSLNTLVLAQVSPKLSGEMSVRGTVTLNGINATSGATVLDMGKIKTANNGVATINLGSLGQVELASDSELVLKVDNGVIGGNLRSGKVIVSTPSGVRVNILTTEGVAATEGNEAAIVSVDVSCGNTRVMSSKSDARLTSGTKVEYVAAGQEIAVGSPNPQAPNCKRMAVIPAHAGLASGALAALLIAGIGGALVGIIATTQGDDTTVPQLNISGFRP